MSEQGPFAQTIEGQEIDASARGYVHVKFKDCTFTNLRGAHIVNCLLENCRIAIDDPRKLLGATITLNCNTFGQIKLSPMTADCILYLAAMGAPDEAKRAKIQEVIAPERLALFERLFPILE